MNPLLVDPWLLELLVVLGGSHSGSERRSLSRDVAVGLLFRVRQGVYVEAGSWAAMTVEQQHVVRMRALAAVSPEVPVFSHWSAALVLGLPVDRAGLVRMHVSGAGDALNGRKGVSGHRHPATLSEIQEVGGLLVTFAARTVVDVAASAGFEAGVQVADAALFDGLPRAALEEATDLAAARRAAPRIGDVVAFAHPGAESANESQARCTMYRMGVDVPELQHRFSDARGFVASVDTWWLRVRGIGEADGAKKYLDPEFALQGAGAVVHAEKLREDRLRALCAGFARWGWEESRSASRLGPVLARIGVVPLRHRPTLGDWAAAARSAAPRPHPRVQPSSTRPILSGTSDAARRPISR